MQTCYINIDNSNLERPPLNGQPEQYTELIARRHVRRTIILPQKKKKKKGYIDAKDGNVSAGNTRYAVLEPQTVSLLLPCVSNSSLVHVRDEKRLTHVMLL
jgi:hypothetical protein